MLGNFGEISSIVKDTILKTIWSIVPIFCFLGVMLSLLIFVNNKFKIKFNNNFSYIICSFKSYEKFYVK